MHKPSKNRPYYRLNSKASTQNSKVSRRYGVPWSFHAKPCSKQSVVICS